MSALEEAQLMWEDRRRILELYERGLVTAHTVLDAFGHDESQVEWRYFDNTPNLRSFRRNDDGINCNSDKV